MPENEILKVTRNEIEGHSPHFKGNLPMWSLGTFGSDFSKLKVGTKTLMPNPKPKTASNESKKANPCSYSILYKGSFQKLLSVFFR